MFGLDVALDYFRKAPGTETPIGGQAQSVAPQAYDLTGQIEFDDVELTDPRGGRVINSATQFRYNNMHVPYRGGDFQAAHLTPDGQECGYMWMLPYVEDTLTDDSTLHAIKSLKDRATGLGGQNAQRWAPMMTFGVMEND